MKRDAFPETLPNNSMRQTPNQMLVSNRNTDIRPVMYQDLGAFNTPNPKRSMRDFNIALTPNTGPQKRTFKRTIPQLRRPSSVCPNS